MIKHIEILTEKRQTGKTTMLLNKFREFYAEGKGRKPTLITYSEKEAQRLRKILKLDDRESILRVRSYASLKGKSFICPVDGEMILLIDEPFLIDAGFQRSLLEVLESCPIKFNIIGIGTLREGFKRDFTHYVDWSKNED